jgi:lysophospholipase L1-like esterase
MGVLEIPKCGRQSLRLLLITLLIAAGQSRSNADESLLADPNPARFEDEIKAFEAWDRQSSFPQHAVLFVGSSSIRKWQTAESFPDLPVINRGFGGSHVSEVNHFADRIVFKYSPRTIVFYAGDNDIADGKSPERVAQGVESIAGLVHTRLPDTQFIFLPIKPSLARWSKWPEMQAANSQVEEFARGKSWIIYVDTATPMLGNDGKPRPELFVEDGLHMNAAGYQIWNEKLRPVLQKAVTEH